MVREDDDEKRRSSPQSTRERTCHQCGMLLDHPAEFHPYVFCVLKKAGRDPWREVIDLVEMLGFGPLPDRPPLVRDLNSVVRDA
jgi:hypothetical protein